jgi:hypothetical protein
MLLSILVFFLNQPIITSGKLIDADDKQPIIGAIIYSSIDTAYSSLDGSFSLLTSDKSFTVKYLSYENACFTQGGILELLPIKPKEIIYKGKK